MLNLIRPVYQGTAPTEALISLEVWFLKKFVNSVKLSSCPSIGPGGWGQIGIKLEAEHVTNFM